MASLREYRDVRIAKLQVLRKLGVDPFPATSHRDTLLGDVEAKLDTPDGQRVVVAGRVMSVRKHGQLSFIDVRDASGRVQLYIRADELGKADHTNSELAFDELPLLDEGDFVEAAGAVTRTKTGQVSVGVQSLRILAKSLRPMPSERDGLKDKETRIRRRYLDTNLNPEVYQRFIRRSRFWQATRDFLNARGFLEINTPVLEHTTGGADANPFITHMDALGEDFYLRISHELPLKRLVGGGYEKVYDIGPRFRNENYSDEHLPEHVAMEWYWAYADWRDGMKFMTEMYRYVLKETFGTLQFTLGRFEIDLSKEWEEWDYAETIHKRYSIDVYNCTLDEVKRALAENKLEVEKTENKARGIDKLWKHIRKDVAGPIWLVNTPLFISPLAKTNPAHPDTVERFQPVIAGTELGNGFSELNDPLDQLHRFVQQQQMRDAGDEEAMMLDIDYIEMLEYGMPPTCGWGHSERVFWVFEGVTAREGVIFPQLRRETDEVTKGIYPELNFGTGAMDSKAPKATTELPLSAAEQGTRKLYLDDYTLRTCDARIQSAEDLGEGTYRFVLDQTCLYPGGGGQDFDLGTITWQGGQLKLAEVGKDKAGIVYHDGVLEGDVPAIGVAVQCEVDTDRRFLNSRLHCAGHLIDYAVHQIEPGWKPGRGSHYPGRCFVEYDGTFDAEVAETMARKIEEILAQLAQEGGAISSTRVPSAEAREHSAYIPDAILRQYQNVHVARYPHNFEICCGGTHLTDVSQLGQVIVTKLKKKNGHIRISYDIR